MLRGVYYHYSEYPHLTVSKIEMTKEPVIFKPTGFWVSDDSRGCGWKDWCLSEGFRLESLVYQYQVVVDLTNVLVLDTKKKLDDFAVRYSDFSSGYLTARVDWAKLREDYSGVAFTPYNREWAFNWGEGEDLWWYSSIDCDSVCIWNTCAILSLGKAERISL